MYHIILHEEKCLNARAELLHGNTDCAKSYYPMIALNRPHAIYGLPPQPTIPNPCLPIPQVEYEREMHLRTVYQQQLQQHRLFTQNRAATQAMQTDNAGGQPASPLMAQQQQIVTQSRASVTGMQSANSQTEIFSQSQQLPHEAKTSQTSLKRELETSHETFEDCPRKLPKES
ncbi:uncharacterized protein N7496_006093 [Penicillium cataractarum]|uniref:Uncharacterized protein n=1 Tax=Penicillium cataractarum TaxID=2100454 RepID=A0A9W9V8A4_9EURO|nr:uncharacterized protein N7496_006067 [Penicillium cataractarum]XP_056554435.1 uncharacterized protein N7496_006093 [Penicillium cataractarum]KAJ5369975.1 hypothetical protein N7496_006067 [Penicillium cataractarum]KAJ5370001.1 hypothetical protein N7496_006093 [Penicillium cataractarum]